MKQRLHPYRDQHLAGEVIYANKRASVGKSFEPESSSAVIVRSDKSEPNALVRAAAHTLSASTLTVAGISSARR